ncbi:sensor histidine kinase [Vallitalea guaymasensis]|uniref:histidine kinase n=1 Tax=Vallitalea guaymasensis TaxID=1185412 RepID=A0A8J8MBZ1_9FIRM|nr:histidine kinase [Vallitalea guaymasensis]QUH29983.1 histidine kinase [Vallitalea guaymasensis]
MKKRILPSLKLQFTVLVLSIIIVFIFLNIITGKLISNLLFEKNLQYSRTISQKLVRELEYTNKRMVAASSTLQYESILQKYFKEELDFDTITKVEKSISVLKLYYDDIFDIALIDDEYINSIYLERETLNEIVKRAEDDRRLKCVGLYEQNYMDKNITTIAFDNKVFGMDMGDTYGEYFGDIIISVDVDTILKNFEARTVQGISFVILDKYNKFYPINCTKEVGTNIINKIDGNTTKTDMLTDDKSIIIVEEIKDMDLYIVSNIDKKYTKKDVGYIQLIISIICIIFIIIVCFAFMVIYKNTVKPIHSIGDYLKTIISGNYKKLKEKVIVNGNKEIVELADDLNDMIDEINTLTHKLVNTSNNLYQAEIEKKRAEISYLRSQINPHFLYNTLETMKGIAMSNNIVEISTMAQCLGDIFRYSIKGSSEVTLEEEVKMIKAYIDIQMFKFGNKGTVFYNINNETLNIIIPKMIMQPLVENAFVHAIEKNTDDTTLYIGTKIDEHNLIIIIQDDGVGIEPSQLDGIIANLDSENDDSSHVGISNVHRRIRMIYGNEYGVKIESEHGEGTKISIMLPINRKQFE